MIYIVPLNTRGPTEALCGHVGWISTMGFTLSHLHRKGFMYDFKR